MKEETLEDIYKRQIQDIVLKQDYLNSNGTECPYCNGNSLEGLGNVEIDSGIAWQLIGCNDCERTWHDTYTLTGVKED